MLVRNHAMSSNIVILQEALHKESAIPYHEAVVVQEWHTGHQLYW